MFRSRCCKTLIAVCALAACLWSQTAATQSAGVTPVEGESWLNHLHRSFDDTSMGKTGRLGPPAPLPEVEDSSWQLRLTSSSPPNMTLHGVDLYRMNCRGCHGEAGLGAPPEIHSVINPVRAGSVAAVMERMKKSGMEIGRADAEKLAQQSRDSLRQRIHQGGREMPAFPHLNESEVRSLVAYLKELAYVPGAKSEQIAVRESPERMGEQIVKSTCHICHGGSGANPTPEQIMDGAIPPLSTLTTRVTQSQFVRKVTHGAVIEMGTPPALYRGRMPVFYYLSQEEAADVYVYLSLYRPRRSVPTDSVMASIADDADTGRTQKFLAASFVPERGPAKASQSGQGVESIALPAVVGMLVTLLLAGGVCFTLRECMSLSANREGRCPSSAKVELDTPRLASEVDRQVA